MKSSNIRRAVRALLLALLPCYAAAALAGTVFHWRGAGDSGSVANVANWTARDPQRDYPGHGATDDQVVIADDSLRRQVLVDAGTLTVGSLCVGDNHEIVLSDDVQIVGSNGRPGRLELEGNVTISGDGRIVTDGIYVNSPLKTVITVGGRVLVTTPVREQEGG